MKLYILRPNFDAVDNPWEPWYDKAFGFVVRADNEIAARNLAHKDAGDENRKNQNPWLNANYSTCEILAPDGDAEVVIKDFASA